MLGQPLEDVRDRVATASLHVLGQVSTLAVAHCRYSNSAVSDPPLGTASLYVLEHLCEIDVRLAGWTYTIVYRATK